MSSNSFSEWKNHAGFGTKWPMEPSASNSIADKIEVGKRLRKVRKALGLTGKSLAGMIGLGCTEQKISNYERGTDGLPRQYAARLWATTGADFNYIYGGSMLTLPDKLRDRILELDDKPVSRPRKKRA